MFIDFDGCFALTCGTCKCAFCAWCLKDCGADAHACAAACGHRLGFGGYHAPKNAFDTAQRDRRQRELDAFFNHLKPELRQPVAEKCRRDAADLGLRVPDALPAPQPAPAQIRAQPAFAAMRAQPAHPLAQPVYNDLRVAAAAAPAQLRRAPPPPGRGAGPAEDPTAGDAVLAQLLHDNPDLFD